MSYIKADYACEICRGVGPTHPVECHEIWEYDDKDKIQRLLGLISLCPRCHEVKHIGLAQVKGNLDRATSHLAKINKVSYSYAHAQVRAAFDVWAQRSKHKWTLDISWLKSMLNDPKPKKLSTAEENRVAKKLFFDLYNDK